MRAVSLPLPHRSTSHGGLGFSLQSLIFREPLDNGSNGTPTNRVSASISVSNTLPCPKPAAYTLTRSFTAGKLVQVCFCDS